MTTLVANVPPVKVWVRREYLRDLRDGRGEYTPGYWVTCKSLSGRALYFETYLTEYGALYDKLPISATARNLAASEAFASFMKRPEKAIQDIVASKQQQMASAAGAEASLRQATAMQQDAAKRFAGSFAGKYI